MEKKLGKIIHLGIVVEDAHKAAEIYENEFGIGPWEIEEPKEFFADKTVNGKLGLDIVSALYKGEGYEIELISPKGPSVYKEWLDQHGPSLHHIKFETDRSYDDIMGMAKRISGRKPYLDVRWPDGAPLVAYVDMLKETGLLLEVRGEEQR